MNNRPNTPKVQDKFLMSFKKDGVDHVRVGLGSATRIGTICAKELRRLFFIPQMGEFTSPVCFANWLVTGDEMARHDPSYRSMTKAPYFKDAILFAKFFQLLSIRSTVKNNFIDLPFASYKVHASGVREFHIWREYPMLVKELALYVANSDKTSPARYPLDQGIVETVNKRIKEIAAMYAPDPEEEEEPKPAKKSKTARKRKAKAKKEEQGTQEPAVEPEVVDQAEPVEVPGSEVEQEAPETPKE